MKKCGAITSQRGVATCEREERKVARSWVATPRHEVNFHATR